MTWIYELMSAGEPELLFTSYESSFEPAIPEHNAGPD